MATYTPNLNLTKPAQTDGYDIDVYNDNLDDLDTWAGTKNTEVSELQSDVTELNSDVANLNTSITQKSSKARRYTATFPATGWVGDAAPYAQAVTVTGLQATDVPITDVVLQSTTEDGMTAELEAYGMIAKFETSANTVTATCNENKPETDITIQMVVFDINDTVTPTEPEEATVLYGVRWTKTGTSTALERTDDAAGLSFTPQVVGQVAAMSGSSGFDDQPVYKDIKRCNVVNGVVTAYEGDPGFSMTPTRGDVMVEIPRFYYKVTNNSTEFSVKISNKPLEGFYVSPLHRATADDQQGEAKAYVSAYFLDATGRSTGAAAAPRSAISMPTSWPDYSYPNGYKPSGLMTYATILLLYLVEVADFDSQTAVCNVGLSSATDVNAKSGSLGYHSGGDPAEGWCVYRGIENLWGKTPTVIYDALLFDGLNVVRQESAWSNNAVETSVRVPLGKEPEADSGTADGEEEEVVVGAQEATYVDTGSGYITNFAADDTVPGIILPTETGAAATAIPDQYVTSGLGTSVYLQLYWGAVASTPAAPAEAEDSETTVGAAAATRNEEIPDPAQALTPMGNGGIFSLVSALNLDCFYRLTYLPGLSQRRSYKATFTDREGGEIKSQTVSSYYPFATPPAENPTWDKGFFQGWMPDPRIALTKDTIFEPRFVLGQKKKLPTKGTYDTLEALQAAVTSPAQGDMYQVGTAPPYKVYIYVTADGWVDTGLTQD